MELGNRIIHGDSAEVLKKFPDNCIDFIITSPPYGETYDYNGNSMYDFDTIAEQLFRVLKKGCALVWIEGSSTKNFDESDLPFEHALKFRDIGFTRLDTMIYQKLGFGKPEPLCRKRYVQSFEYMFVLTKDKIEKFNPLIDRPNSCAGKFHTGRTIRQQDGSLETNKKEILYYNKYGLRYNIWQYQNAYGHGTRDKIAYKHPATFPEKMVKDHILTWSNEGDLVLDPFIGSGTVAKVAYFNDRRFVGIEKNSDYIDIINKRLAKFADISVDEMRHLSKDALSVRTDSNSGVCTIDVRQS